MVIHDWERPYYKEGAKSLGYILEKEVDGRALKMNGQITLSIIEPLLSILEPL